MRTPQTPEAPPQMQFDLSNARVADEVALAVLNEMYFGKILLLEARRRTEAAHQETEMLVNADEVLVNESAAASS